MSTESLSKRFALAELTPVWAALRERIERTGGPGSSPLTVEMPDPAARAAAAELPGGVRIDGTRVRIDPTRLDAALHASHWACSLTDVLQAVGGPLADRPAARLAEAERRTSLLARWRAHPALTDDDVLTNAFEAIAAGLVAASDDHAVDDTLAAFGELRRRPGPVELAVLAARVAGDPHALDPDQPAGRMLLRLAWRLREPERPLPQDAETRRQLWADLGIVGSDVSSVVTVAGLTPGGGGVVGDALRQHARAGLELVLTRRQVDVLLSATPHFQHAEVFACENPTVLVAAVRELGTSCPPLLCVGGQVSLAGRQLIAALLGAGATVQYHGDFGSGGITIANSLVGLGCTPWRMGVEDYVVALGHGGTPLKDRLPPARWDPALTETMSLHGIEVHEEAVIEHLLADLANRAQR